MNSANLHKLFLKSSCVSIDTRAIEKNSIFFALKGANFDGNQFADEALKQGASYVVIDNPDFKKNENYILVENVLEALQQLASFHRDYLNIKIIALTGSNGKTTTKELFLAVISQKYKCKATSGNLNNHIGVPLTLLSFNHDTQIGIVEMGANHQKEIEFLCEIAKPDIGYITNFGKAHLEGFGGIEGVIKGKSEMYSYIRNNNKTVLINTDDKLQYENANGIINNIKFSLQDLNIKIDENKSINYLSFSTDNHLVNTNLYGNYNLTNCMAAIALGLFLDVNIHDIIIGLTNYNPSNNRSQWIKKNDLKIVLDAYNANPTSMEHAINNFIKLVGNPKFLILGDMFELGEDAEKEHEKIVEYLKNIDDTKTFFVGKIFYQFKNKTKNIDFFENIEDLISLFIQKKLTSGYLLIKGSRGMKLEKIIDYL
jgi:UDP-N-acetylmuramoyl-tripeptide--D-alanyl-D-alanine ligase